MGRPLTDDARETGRRPPLPRSKPRAVSEGWDVHDAVAVEKVLLHHEWRLDEHAGKLSDGAGTFGALRDDISKAKTLAADAMTEVTRPRPGEFWRKFGTLVSIGVVVATGVWNGAQSGAKLDTVGATVDRLQGEVRDLREEQIKGAAERGYLKNEVVRLEAELARAIAAVGATVPRPKR